MRSYSRNAGSTSRRERHDQVRMALGDAVARAPLVRGIEEGEQEAHRDRLDALRHQLVDGTRRRRSRRAARMTSPSRPDAFAHPLAPRARRQEHRRLAASARGRRSGAGSGRPISSTSREAFGGEQPDAAPLRSSTALVATVVPCAKRTRRSRSGSLRTSVRHRIADAVRRFRPRRRNLQDGQAVGADRQTRSVKVPPTSMPMAAISSGIGYAGRMSAGSVQSSRRISQTTVFW